MELLAVKWVKGGGPQIPKNPHSVKKTTRGRTDPAALGLSASILYMYIAYISALNVPYTKVLEAMGLPNEIDTVPCISLVCPGLLMEANHCRVPVASKAREDQLISARCRVPSKLRGWASAHH